MPAPWSARSIASPIAATAAALCVAVTTMAGSQQTSQQQAQNGQPQPANTPTDGRVAIRGCLSGSKLAQLEPQGQIALKLPDTLFVTSIRVIRDQVKALDGHQVEVIGTLHGIPGQENGILVADSANGKVYIGGGDPRLGQDLTPGTQPAPGIQASTIKDIAPACAARQPK